MDSLPNLFEDALLEDYEEAMEIPDPLVTPTPIVSDPSEPVSIVEAPSLTPALQNNDVPAPVDPSDSKTESTPVQPSRPKPPCCSLCKKPHPLRGCFRFRQMPHENKLRHILTFGHCSRCLSVSHPVLDCASRKTCSKCQGNHNTLLCSPTRGVSKTLKEKKQRKTSKSAELRPILTTSLPLRHVVSLSPTLQVKLAVGDKRIRVRVVLDLCCDTSYISNELMKSLRIPEKDSYCHVSVCSIYDPTKHISLTVKVRSMNGIKTPIEDVDEKVCFQFPGFQFADPTFYRSSQVAMVFGPEIGSRVLTGQSFTSPGGLLAQYTIFGWVLSGQSPI